MTSTTRKKKINNKIIFLFGPTASGKTALTLSHFASGFQIINADSVQVYRHLDIASAKPSIELQKKIKHHLVDILDPWQQFTVSDFITLGDEACERIWNDGDIPLVTGGTAFYFKHFLYGLSDAPKSTPEVREMVQKMLDEEGREALHRKLLEVDEKSGKRININDTYRLTRALEVYYQTGKPLSYFELPSMPRNGLEPLIIGLERDKSELDKRIALRVDEMFDMGVLEEMRTLIRMGATPSWPGMCGIGYSEFFTLMDSGEFTVKRVKELIIRNSRKYAKRQMTFFKSFKDVLWIHPEDTSSLDRALESYLNTPNT
ncbi:MAG: tRNA (adenosine(37)-N6)-dimethylallyltransferase MiaA [Sphaerochaetaceae bacterium]|nr:tRNA (adenosine(37)-N6)-dimethylallyltransferase MiaA [Sphaerochaetaceae bacterium]